MLSRRAERNSAVPRLIVSNGVLLPCLNRNDIEFSFEIGTAVAGRLEQALDFAVVTSSIVTQDRITHDFRPISSLTYYTSERGSGFLL